MKTIRKMVHIHKINEIPTDFSKYTFGKPIKGDGFYSMYITTKDEQDNVTNLFFQSPKMSFMTDFASMDNETRDACEYVDMSCDNEEYIELMNTLDEVFMNAIKSNADEWFPGKNIDDTFLEVGQVKNLRKGNIVKFKLTEDTEAFNHERDAIDIQSIGNSQSVKALIELVGLWFTSNRWGVMWKLAQIKTCDKTKKNTVRGYMFPEEDEPEVEHKNILKPPPGV